jgi:hypothetical protein
MTVLLQGFCVVRLSIEFRQIKAAPPLDRDWCRSGDSSQACTSPGERFETTPTSLIAIISTSAPHCGHQDRSGFRPRRTRSESVSIVILVRFVIACARATHRAGSTWSRVPGEAGNVLRGGMILSDDFSVRRRLQKLSDLRALMRTRPAIGFLRIHAKIRHWYCPGAGDLIWDEVSPDGWKCCSEGPRVRVRPFPG